MRIADAGPRPRLNWNRHAWAIVLHAIVFVALGPLVGVVVESLGPGGWLPGPFGFSDLDFWATLFTLFFAYGLGFWPALIAGGIVGAVAGFVRSEISVTAISAFVGVAAAASFLVVVGFYIPLAHVWLAGPALEKSMGFLVDGGVGAIACTLLTRKIRSWMHRPQAGRMPRPRQEPEPSQS